MNNKKGQVTLFIILGIIIIIIIGVAMFLIAQHKKQLPNPYEVNYDAKLAPLYNDVVFCMNSLGKEAAQKIGAGGGYLDTDPELYNYNLPLAYSNNALEIFPESGMVIPYWFHIQGAPDCKVCPVEYNIPVLEGSTGRSIQNQMETYVEKNLINCLDNFSAHKADMNIEYSSLPVCKVEFRDENTVILVNWTLAVEFSDGTKSDSLKFYSTTLDVRLKKMYEFSKSILFQMELMTDHRAMEDFTKDIISVYSFGTKDALIPPAAGPTLLEVSAPKIWLRSNVEEILKRGISETIPFVQVKGTKDSFVLFTEDPIEDNFYSKFQNTVYYDSEFSSQVRVRFNYYGMWWPLYVSVGPTHSEVIMPETNAIDLWLIRLGTSKYRFYYDVTYPVLVTLEDDAAFRGEGFLFQFPYEVNIRSNKPYSNDTIDLNEVYPEMTGGEDLGYEQRTVPITLNVINGYNGLPMPDIDVNYLCINNKYIVGTSAMYNGNALIESLLSPCLNGALTVSSIGYSESLVNVDAVVDNPLVLDYKVYPEKNVTLEVKKRLFKPALDKSAFTNESDEVNREWSLEGDEGIVSTMEEDEVFIFIMTEQREDGGVGAVEYIKSNESDRILSLVPGKYSIQLISTVQLGEGYTRANVTIPPRLIKADDEDVVINQTVLEKTMYMGGVTIDETTTGLFEITPQMLQTKSSLVVYYASYDIDEIYYLEDLNVLSMVQSASTNDPELFIPVME
ncbi:MAG: hypothetical protein ACP5N3_03750 [Candidatus Nanoarchaeia archaeon]